MRVEFENLETDELAPEWVARIKQRFEGESFAECCTVVALHKKEELVLFFKCYEGGLHGALLDAAHLNNELLDKVVATIRMPYDC